MYIYTYIYIYICTHRERSMVGVRFLICKCSKMSVSLRWSDDFVEKWASRCGETHIFEIRVSLRRAVHFIQSQAFRFDETHIRSPLTICRVSGASHKKLTWFSWLLTEEILPVKITVHIAHVIVLSPLPPKFKVDGSLRRCIGPVGSARKKFCQPRRRKHLTTLIFGG